MRCLLNLVIAACLVATALGYASDHKHPFDYRAMTDWPRLCNNGKLQSPINIYTKEATIAKADTLRAIELNTMGTLSKYDVHFTGTCMQISFVEWSVPADIKIPANEISVGNSTTIKEYDMLEVEPIQMHIHTMSEHTLDGFYAPGELHIVTRIKDGQSDHCDSVGGCVAVFAVLLAYERHGNSNHHILKHVFEDMPEAKGEEEAKRHKEEINLDELIPEDKDYYTYIGSVTTPPCTEVVTWHVFAEPIEISAELIQQHQHFVSFTPGEDCTYNYHGYCSPPREKTNNRPIQRHMGRDVYFIRE